MLRALQQAPVLSRDQLSLVSRLIIFYTDHTPIVAPPRSDSSTVAPYHTLSTAVSTLHPLVAQHAKKAVRNLRLLFNYCRSSLHLASYQTRGRAHRLTC